LRLPLVSDCCVFVVVLLSSSSSQWWCSTYPPFLTCLSSFCRQNLLNTQFKDSDSIMSQTKRPGMLIAIKEGGWRAPSNSDGGWPML
jgi:hypothetical protein